MAVPAIAHAPDPELASQSVVNAVVAFRLRHRRPPRLLLVESNAVLRRELASELLRRGLHVVELANARALHAELVRSFADAEGRPIDVVVADAKLPDCSPLHALAYARRRGLRSTAVLLTDANDVGAREEAHELGLHLCARANPLESIDHALLRALRRLWSESPPESSVKPRR
jgi:CheY-like chemotaxis protein